VQAWISSWIKSTSTAIKFVIFSWKNLELPGKKLEDGSEIAILFIAQTLQK
jgi:hypothetical protein